jgi:phosphate starvation-inducible membrane PsiE
MLILLAIIVVIALIALAAYFLQVHGKEEYNYSILSIGGLGVSFLGVIAFVVSYYYYRNDNPFGMIVFILLGCTPYVMMLIRDTKKMNIPLAFASGLLRLVISALLIVAILCYCMKGTSKED